MHLPQWLTYPHVTDIVEPGGGPGGSDRLFEAKVVSPCTLAERQGAEIRGQKPSKRGYLFGFGNTEESYRIMIYGTAARGLPADGPFDEDTGQGFVPQRPGHVPGDAVGGRTPHDGEGRSDPRCSQSVGRRYY